MVLNNANPQILFESGTQSRRPAAGLTVSKWPQAWAHDGVASTGEGWHGGPSLLRDQVISICLRCWAGWHSGPRPRLHLKTGHPRWAPTPGAPEARAGSQEGLGRA